jgi:hypothetical protein
MERMPKIVWRFFLHPLTRYVVAWIVALTAAGLTLLVAWTAFNSPKHADGTPKRRGGNNGHTLIDFGGQWLIGRMLVQGLGPHLYHRNYQRPVLRAAYPVEDEISDEDRKPEERGETEAEALMGWLMGHDDPQAARAAASFLAPLAAPDPLGTAVLIRGVREWEDDHVREATIPQRGGPLYPPIHAFVMYPFGRLQPRLGYRCVQIFGVLLAFVAGWGIRLLSQGRIWWPVAVTLIVLYPGFANTVNLGQSSVLALTVLIWGWTLMARDHPVWGGVIWGLLAFKPVWAMAFFLVPLLTGRWRVCLAMVTTGAGLAAATLPWVGWQTWLDWLGVGRQATWLYSVDENWIFLSRDLVSIPRRWLIDFKAEVQDRDNLAATLAGWALLLAVVECTVRLAILRPQQARAVTGPSAAFLFLGAWLSCFHFMYYDVLLTALPVLLLLTEPRRYLKPTLVAILPLPADKAASSLAQYHQPQLAAAYPGLALFARVGFRQVCVLNSMTLSLLVLLVITEFMFPQLNICVSVSAHALKKVPLPLPLKYSTELIGTPWNTFTLMALWFWCGWLWLRMSPQESAGEW